ncbi:MAG: sarcosine oxidase subunit gamma [Sphingorhabdus sp.]|uniref:sarcosine oxidase subunit gamma n=1 Tax=Sphingorhabdus sp. TaxID=1902408 RepID=UPI0038FC82EC
MSDTLTRVEPVPSAPYVGEGISISLAAPMMRYSLRARHPQALETLLGIKVPKKIGATEEGIACLGPDEWLLRAPIGSKIVGGPGLPVSIVDISERAICLVVEGPRCGEILNAGCPLDLDKFAVGRATRTIFETVEIVLLRLAEDRFHVEVWRSFAPWMWTALTTAAHH